MLSISANVNFSNLRVLLVEAHLVNTMVTKRLPEKYGAKVETANDETSADDAGQADVIAKNKC
jgi:CheY-like chemotaxis protein